MATASDHNNLRSGTYDVVVVGAGISGLCAAYDILKERKDSKVVVLEAKDRVGGRLDSAQLQTANGVDTWDVGGQWVGREQKDIMCLLKELGVETYRQWYEGDKMIQLGDKALRKYHGSYPSVSYLSLLDTYLIINKIERLCTMVPLDDPSQCLHAEEWDGMTVETWSKQHAWTTATIEMLEIAVSCIFGVTPAQISLLFFFHYVKTCGGWKRLTESGLKDGAQEYKIKGTAHNVAKILAEKIGWKKIKLGQPVSAVRQNAENVVVVTCNGQKYVAKYVILAIPPHLTNKIDFTPRLPYNKQRITQNMIPSHLTKFIVTYPTAFWREKGLSGEVAHVTGKHHSESDPIALTFDATTHDGSPAILGFIASYAAAKWSDKSEEEKKEAIIKSLDRYLGPDAEQPLDCAVKEWSQEEWNGGCPVDIMVPGAITNYGDCLKEPFKRLHWAGTETSNAHRGYISGGVHSGYRAAKEVMEKLKADE